MSTKTSTKRTRKAESTKATRKQTPAQQIGNAAALDPNTQGLDDTTEQTSTETTVPVTTKQPKPMPTLDEALAKARETQPALYHDSRVVRVTQLTSKGTPKRVVITCQDPQTKQGTDGQPISVCQGEREIAVQDLFQVTLCAACADRVVRKARRNRAKTKAKAMRKAMAATKGN